MYCNIQFTTCAVTVLRNKPVTKLHRRCMGGTEKALDVLIIQHAVVAAGVDLQRVHAYVAVFRQRHLTGVTAGSRAVCRPFVHFLCLFPFPHVFPSKLRQFTVELCQLTLKHAERFPYVKIQIIKPVHILTS